jgi:TolB protein
MNADGSNAAQLTRDAGFDVTPAWSPAGDRIAFSRYNTADPTLGNDIVIVPVATGVSQRLALPGDQFSPAFSPDGHYIALSGTVVAGQGVAQLYTMRHDGSGLRLRTVNPAWGGGVHPSWIRR